MAVLSAGETHGGSVPISCVLPAVRVPDGLAIHPCLWLERHAAAAVPAPVGQQFQDVFHVPHDCEVCVRCVPPPPPPLRRSCVPVPPIRRWLAVWLDVSSIAVLAFAAFGSVGLRHVVNPGVVGLALSYVMQLTVTIQWLVRQSAEIENQMVSVERIIEYSKLNVRCLLAGALPLPHTTATRARVCVWLCVGRWRMSTSWGRRAR